MKKALLIAGIAIVVLASLFFALRMRNPFQPQLPAVSAEPKEKPAPAAAPQAEPSSAPSPAAKGSFDAMLKEAAALEGQGELLRAQEALKNIVATYSSKPGIEEVQKRLENVNMRILFSALNISGTTTTYEVKEKDFLQKVAKQFGTTIDLIKRENGLSSDIIRPGMRLRIWTGKFSVLVDKSQNLLTLKSNGEVLRTYRVATGKENITPVGTFKVINKLVNPDWSHEGKVIPFGDPQNILGTRWLGFNVPGYGIHGTSQPESIGKQATAGCVRMLNNEVEELYSILPVGTEVTIID